MYMEYVCTIYEIRQPEYGKLEQKVSQ